MGGRSSKSGMSASSSASGGAGGIGSVFGGRSAKSVADSYWDKLKISPGEKYGQVQSAANGDMLGYHVSEAIRTQAGSSNPDLFRNGSWRMDYQDKLIGKLGSSGENQLKSALQNSAKSWLKKHPKPKHPRKDGYKWDGTKYVK